MHIDKISENPKLPIPEELKWPLFKLADDGTTFDIEKFLRAHGEQAHSFELDAQSIRAVRRIIELMFYDAEQNLEEFNCSKLKLLKSSGLLNASDLTMELKNLLKNRDGYSPIVRERLLRSLRGNKGDLASSQVLSDAITKRIKEVLDWDIHLAPESA